MKKKSIVLIFSCLALILLSFSCRGQLQFTNPIPLDTSFKIEKPSLKALKRYQLAADYSSKVKGYAVLVIKGDKLIFEEYQNGHTGETPSHLFSGTKSFAGIMAVAAIEDKLITLDEKVAETITEFKEDPLKTQITVRHLLNFTSGLKQEFLRLTLDGMKPAEAQRIKDKYKYSLTLPVKTKPGEVYKYGSSHLMVFGEFMKRKLKENPLTYLERRIFKPLNFRYAGWHKDAQGNPALPYGAWTTAREWAKIGMFLRDKGKFNGQQIVPKKWIEKCTKGSKAMPAYGLTFWLNNKVPKELRSNLIPQLKDSAEKGRAVYPDGPKDLYVAAGHNGNRLYIIPSQNIVIVRLGDKERSYSDQEFLARILNGKSVQ